MQTALAFGVGLNGPDVARRGVLRDGPHRVHFAFGSSGKIGREDMAFTDSFQRKRPLACGTGPAP